VREFPWDELEGRPARRTAGAQPLAVGVDHAQATTSLAPRGLAG
jgi:hypothetical protein